MKYQTILMDPPWPLTGGGDKRAPNKHYPVMPYGNIVHLIDEVLKDKVADNAHIYIWVVASQMKDGWNLMSHLGFRYMTNIVWVKDRVGLGRYIRTQHELCFFGIKGRLLPNFKDFKDGRYDNSAKVKEGFKMPSSVIMAKRREHSRKPDEMYELIENVSPGPYLELFARHKRPGWKVWGNQTDKFKD